MSPDRTILTPDERDELQLTVLVRGRLEEQFQNLEQQHEVASLGMWIFLATEVMFFGTLFLGLGLYGYLYPDAFAKGSARLNWIIGGINTIVLLTSSLTMVLAVHAARLGNNRHAQLFLALTAALGVLFLCFKGLEYYLDYEERLIPGWSFDAGDWVASGLRPDQVPQVQLFLVFYWVMTGFHALHVTIGVMATIALVGNFSRTVARNVLYLSPYWAAVSGLS